MRWRDVIRAACAGAAVALAAAVLVGRPVPARGQGMGEGPGLPIEQDSVPVATCETLELPSASWAPVGVAGSRCTLTPLGGGGGAAAPLLSLASCTPIDGTTQVYLGGGCADPNEPFVQIRVKGAATFGQLACALSGVAGNSAVVTATLRAGTCGGLTDSSVTCVIGSGGTTCDGGSGTVALIAGQCASLRITSSATFGTLRALGCTLRVVG